MNNTQGMAGSLREIELPLISDPRGDLTFVEGQNHVPFPIRRVYYLYNVPVDSKRGGHAHRQLEQVIFALSGSFRLTVDDGQNKSEFWLRNPRKGLYVNNLIWREMDNFSQGAVCMVLASQPYEEADYYRNYDDFLAAARANPDDVASGLGRWETIRRGLCQLEQERASW
ncbi:FdtA/QdtA family cupin domain-containing protein [Cognatiyoonia sp. IB215182]|uniref:sugar 3,4-ketoisomerase n=1 Tax=Cognatiyoonia sp. IB215182 TaxID=3097353 RepID=UPI002A0F9684|nr:FdtA/QdtA family cupin domain-containing protein [Cognatiyoonia sp. IB215182]MDX8354716.1 FdtA/QdtA family cupin domain-containing protein [Cognatiyoonia sp. IB215182]